MSLESGGLRKLNIKVLKLAVCKDFSNYIDQILTVLVARKYLSHLTGATHHVLDVSASDKELYTSLRLVVVKP